jgi:hypothetical protein
MKNKLAVKRTALGFVCSYILEDSAESIGQVPFCFQPKEEILRDHARSVHMLILSGLFDSSLLGTAAKHITRTCGERISMLPIQGTLLYISNLMNYFC